MDAATARRAYQDRRYRGYVLGLLVAVGVCGWVDRNVLAVLLESIKADLALSDTELGLLGGLAFGVFYAGVGLPVAWLADRCNRRSLIAISLGLWSLMTALCGLASSFAALFACRVGVGIGEAGGSPPSQSLVSDYFEPERRASALGVLYLYVPLGFLVGFAVGGWLDELLGWRLAFIVIGLPGVLLALVVRLTLREPLRGGSEWPSGQDARAAGCVTAAGNDGLGEHAPNASLVATLRALWSRRTLRHVPVAGAVHGIGAFAAAVWLPSFMMRTHDLGSAEAGLWMALAYGIGGGLGVVSGGRIADGLVALTGDARWHVWGAAAVILLALPCSILVYTSSSLALALAALFVATLLGHMFLGPVTAVLQNLAEPHRRAVTAASYLFLVNLVSMGLGPVAVGWTSDRFSPTFGDDALRYALLGLTAATSLWSAAHFLAGARTLVADRAAARAYGRGPRIPVEARTDRKLRDGSSSVATPT